MSAYYHNLSSKLTLAQTMKIKYFNSVIYILVIVFILRLAELIGIAVQIPKHELMMLIGLTALGLITDLIFVIAIILFLNLLYHKKGIPKWFHYGGMTLFHMLLFSHLIMLVYYIHQRIPLGIILYQHNFDEVYLTATNSGYSMNYLTLILLATILLFGIIYWYISRKSKKVMEFKDSRYPKLALSFCLIFIVLESFFPIRGENYYVNNTNYFIRESISYFWEKSHPMDLSYNASLIETYQTFFSHNYTDKNFPLLHETDTINHLKPYFKPFTQKPTIVFLIVEGLNDDFIHDRSGLTLMPFLSSLKNKSLYWENCFTLGERSFAAVPSLLGSLIYGKNGFMQLDAYPHFTSMANVLKANDYHIRFNYGQGAWFHSKDRFFKWQDVDVIFDKDVFDPSLPKMMVDDGYFWGYDDITFLSETIKNLDKYPQKPSMEVYFTGSMHSPYIIPQKEKYIKAFRTALKNVSDAAYKSQLQAYEKYYVTTQVTDDAIKQFITSYAERPEFQNTLFIITGDHPMTEAPVQNSLKRYHVPLLFYSSKLIKPAISKNVVSHLDVQQTLYNILRNNGIEVPKTSVALGKTLKVEGNDKNRSFVFMNGHRFLEDIYSNGYYLSKNQLYKVEESFKLKEIVNPKRKQNLEKALHSFKWMSLYTTTQQRLLPVKDYVGAINRTLVKHDKITLKNGTTDEFVNLIKEFPLTNNTTLELFYNNKSEDPAVRIAIALVDKNNEHYYYEEIYNNIGKKHSIKIPLILKSPSDKLKVYIFNPNRSIINMDEIELLLHQ